MAFEKIKVANPIVEMDGESNSLQTLTFDGSSDLLITGVVNFLETGLLPVIDHVLDKSKNKFQSVNNGIYW